MYMSLYFIVICFNAVLGTMDHLVIASYSDILDSICIPHFLPQN